MGQTINRKQAQARIKTIRKKIEELKAATPTFNTYGSPDHHLQKLSDHAYELEKDYKTYNGPDPE